MSDVQLHGRVVLSGQIRTVTGLRIGGRPMGIEIGGIDNIVLRNPVSGEPYIPGSSLKGKMRSLLSRATGADPNNQMDTEGRVNIHSCHESTEEAYRKCKVCPIFGMPAEGDVRADYPTPIIVRDVPLWLPDGDEAAGDYGAVADRLQRENYTEVKWEAVIDRVTSAAMPRQMERVPAGAIFGPFEIVYNVYSQRSHELLPYVGLALQLVQDDYLGGQGSRGSGKVAFENLTVSCRTREKASYVTADERSYASLDELVDARNVWEWAQSKIPVAG